MRHGSLFSGIGGFDLAAEWMGWENIFHCEWNEFGKKVLKHYWPNAISYDNIKTTDFTIHRGGIDILTGGFPCQPYSQAGKRKGKADERHLWPEMLRAIREIQPCYIVGENVRGLTNWNGGLVFDEVQAELEAQGYEVLPFLLPACALNAPHRRDRIWFIAYSASLDRRTWGVQDAPTGKRKVGKQITKGTEVRNTIRSISEIRNVAYTNSDGLQRSNSEHEINSGEGRLDALNDIKPGSDASNANLGNERTLSGELGKVTEENSNIGNDGRQKMASNSDGFGLWGEGDGTGKSRFVSKNDKGNDWQNFPTQSPVCSGDDGFSSRLDSSALLNGRTPRQPYKAFGKWRAESIKAGGNAIVPQVAYEIFKAIQAVGCCPL